MSTAATPFSLAAYVRISEDETVARRAQSGCCQFQRMGDKRILYRS